MAMEINKALERLKQALDEVPELRKRIPEKKHYALWVDEVRNILELTFGKPSREYENFSRAASGDYIADTFAEKLNKYNDELTAYETALKSAIHKGELFSLLGPNGAGKTTTINILCGIFKPTKGTAIVGGYDVRKNIREMIFLRKSVWPPRGIASGI